MDKLSTSLLVIVMCTFALFVAGAVAFGDLASRQAKAADAVRADLHLCRTDLNSSLSALAKAASDVNQSKTDVRKYDDLYLGVVATLNQTAFDLNNTKRQLVQQTLATESARQQLASREMSFNITLRQKDAVIASLQSEVVDWKRKTLSCQNDLQECRAS